MTIYRVEPMLFFAVLLVLKLPITTYGLPLLTRTIGRVDTLLHALTDDVKVPFPPRAEGALRSSGMARTVRSQRANRGRRQDPVRPIHEVTKRQKDLPRPKTGRAAMKSSRRMSGMDLPYESALAALRAYHSHHGDLIIPRRFVVPNHKDYPPRWHSVDLSSCVYNMKWWQRNVREHPDRVAELNKLGFIWERLQPEWNLVMEALVTYRSLHGDLLVPTAFVVPRDSKEYAKATWGIPLGSCVIRIRSRHDFLRGSNSVSRCEQLDGIGFVWDLKEYRFHKFYKALQYYIALEQGTSKDGVVGKRPLRIPSAFTVPATEESGWPRELWKYPLGSKCSAVRQKKLYIKNSPSREKALGDLGFYSGGNASLGWLEVVHAAAIYSQVNHRNLDVPFHFSVPAPPQVDEDSKVTGSDDAWPWPEYLWGLPLGQRLKDIRVKGAYLHGSEAVSRRAQLDALGFNWRPKRGRRRLVPKHNDMSCTDK